MNILPIFQNPTNENVTEFADWVKSKISKKPKGNGLFSSVFKTSWIEKEKKHWQKSNIIAACDYLIFLTQNSSNSFDSKVKICLADLSRILEEFFKDEKFDSLFSLNTHPSYSYWKIVESLNDEQKLPENSNLNTLNLPILYLMRLSLESRVHGFLGIDFIRAKGKSVDLSTLIKITKELKSIEFDPKINWERIEKINHWISHFMHRHIRPFPWVINLTIQELRPLFSWDNRKHDDFEEFGWYLSTTVKSQRVLINELKTYLDRKYDKDYLIRWSGRHEIHLKK